MFKKALMALTLTTALATPALSQQLLPTDRDHSINKVFVSGQGEVTVYPDKIRAVITTTVRNSDRKEAAAENRTLADTVRKAILGAGVTEKGLRTNMTRLDPVYEYPDNSVPKLVGYEAQSSVEITANDASLVGAAIDAAVDAGATGVDGPYFEVSETNEAKTEARRMAMKDALSNAKALSEAGDFSLGNILTVTDGGSVSGGPQHQMNFMSKAMDAGAEAAPATQIDTGEQKISASVSVVFSIAPELGQKKD